MEQLVVFLKDVTGDIFKILPMKEDSLRGTENYLNDYISSLLVNLTGATKMYPELAKQKQYLYIINNLQYLNNNQADFSQWRRIILGSTNNINKLITMFGGGVNGNREHNL